MTDKHQNLWGNPDGGPSALEQAQEEKAGNLLLPRQLDSKASPPENMKLVSKYYLLDSPHA